ncbi:MAG: serine/threonine protein phosphatase [Williamsia herbipolensis]|nr:serine/threonine protein phosphatase [Williamsia herbipolensis]
MRGPRTGVVGRRAEPSRVARADTPLRPEIANAVLSIGFYLACTAIGLLPGGWARPALERYVGWAAAMDERRSQ